MHENNILINTDSYKCTHWKQYPPETHRIYSYFESRGGPLSHTVFFGLQYLLKKHLVGKVVTQEKIDEAEEFWGQHLGLGLFNKADWEYILHTYDGRLPLRIKAVPEGSVIPLKNALMTVENTDDRLFWLTNWVETLLVQAWYPTTIASNSRAIMEMLHKWANIDGTDPQNLLFKVHDFGFRGVSCHEQAMIGGMAHLTQFSGTDNTPGILGASNYYDAEMCGFSIPASEHSTMTAWGGPEREYYAFKNMLDKFPTGVVACVSDSYDIFKACEKLWGDALKDRILHREGTLVVRPDSGDPVETVLRVLLILWKKFGGTTNDMGYKVLDPHIRMIQGDGIDRSMINQILHAVNKAGFALENLAFGSGGGLLQQFDRDTFKFAFKASARKSNDIWTDVYKDPVDMSSKRSKRGRFKVINEITTHTVDIHASGEDLLQEVYYNGALKIETTFDEIKKLAKV